jgi:DNA-binding NarL/FixJ family response regulator
MEKTIKVVTVDDHPLALKGFRSLFQETKDIELIGEASNGLQCLDLLQAKQPDVVLLDIEMPQMGGEETMRNIRKNYPAVKVIIVSFHAEEEYISDLFSKGAHGYIPKCSDLDVLIDAIYTVYKDGVYFNKSISVAIHNGLKKKSETKNDKPILTMREKEVLFLVCEGESNKSIATKLDISVKTVDFHKANIAKKTQSYTPIALVKYAKSNGIIM